MIADGIKTMGVACDMPKKPSSKRDSKRLPVDAPLMTYIRYPSKTKHKQVMINVVETHPSRTTCK